MIGYSKTAQIGNTKPKQVQKNKTANQLLDDLYAKKGIDYCEAELTDQCLKKERFSNGEKLKLTYAHRHKRIWYKEENRGKLLYSFHETIKACLPCHMKMETDRKLTDRVFIKLRGTHLTRLTNTSQITDQK